MKNKKEKAPRNILAEAILKQYQPQTVEDMQEALKEGLSNKLVLSREINFAHKYTLRFKTNKFNVLNQRFILDIALQSTKIRKILNRM